jgi:hypothetical protein
MTNRKNNDTTDTDAVPMTCDPLIELWYRFQSWSKVKLSSTQHISRVLHLVSIPRSITTPKDSIQNEWMDIKGQRHITHPHDSESLVEATHRYEHSQSYVKIEFHTKDGSPFHSCHAALIREETRRLDGRGITVSLPPNSTERNLFESLLSYWSKSFVSLRDPIADYYAFLINLYHVSFHTYLSHDTWRIVFEYLNIPGTEPIHWTINNFGSSKPIEMSSWKSTRLLCFQHVYGLTPFKRPPFNSRMYGSYGQPPSRCKSNLTFVNNDRTQSSLSSTSSPSFERPNLTAYYATMSFDRYTPRIITLRLFLSATIVIQIPIPTKHISIVWQWAHEPLEWKDADWQWISHRIRGHLRYYDAPKPLRETNIFLPKTNSFDDGKDCRLIAWLQQSRDTPRAEFTPEYKIDPFHNEGYTSCRHVLQNNIEMANVYERKSTSGKWSINASWQPSHTTDYF